MEKKKGWGFEHMGEESKHQLAFDNALKKLQTQKEKNQPGKEGEEGGKAISAEQILHDTKLNNEETDEHR